VPMMRKWIGCRPSSPAGRRSSRSRRAKARITIQPTAPTARTVTRAKGTGFHCIVAVGGIAARATKPRRMTAIPRVRVPATIDRRRRYV
jgi:hypothetical protein